MPNNRLSSLKGVNPYEEIILREAQRFNIDPEVLRRLIFLESSFNPTATSSKGAVGLAQLMPDTAKALGVDPTDPAQNIHGGAKYLRQLLDRYNQDLRLALAAYNWGPGNLAKFGIDKAPRETRNYIRRIMGFDGVRHGASSTAPSPKPDSSSVAPKNVFEQSLETLGVKPGVQAPFEPQSYSPPQRLAPFVERPPELDPLFQPSKGLDPRQAQIMNAVFPFIQMAFNRR